MIVYIQVKHVFDRKGKVIIMKSTDIARIANVSRSTVSRVVNGYSNVPEETRIKVQSVIDAYGYKPNVSARMLAGKTNHIIGLFVADINEENSKDEWIGTLSPYNARILSAVIKSCKKRGYLVLVNDITEEKEFYMMQDYFENRMLFGAIFLGFPYQTKSLEEIAQKNNIVLIDQLLQGNMKLINCNNRKVGFMATEYLIKLGHRNIAFIAGNHRLSAIERFEGYKEALEQNGISFDEKLVIQGGYREDIAYQQTKQFLKEQKPTAIFSANDLMAIGAIQAIEELGMQVAEDISIVGVDNLQITQWKDKLTTVAFSVDDMVEYAIGSLFDEEHERICEPFLLEKASCRKI